MARLTEKAKRELGFFTRLRLHVGSWLIGIGVRAFPKAYWDNARRVEVAKMLDRYDEVVVETNCSTDTDNKQ